MDDSDRYREMLQRSLLTEGWEGAFDARRFSEWIRQNGERLRARAIAVLGDNASSYATHVTEVFERFVPRSPYDLPTTEATFRPLFDAVRECAAAIGLQPIREVELVTSTSISPTPFARPTSDVHQLYIGLGTSTFCNYWAKAFTALVTAIATTGPPFKKVESAVDLGIRLSADPRGLVLATRLALYYTAMGSLMGFGEVAEPPASYAYRIQLLMAMEVFAISHEYAHFVAEERALDFVAADGQLSPRCLELFCDELGLQIAREWGSRHDNWLSFTGVGAIALLGALDICQRCAKELSMGLRAGADGPALSKDALPKDESHPPTSERLAHIVSCITEKTAEDQKTRVDEFLGEYIIIYNAIKEMVLSAANRTAADATANPDVHRE